MTHIATGRKPTSGDLCRAAHVLGWCHGVKLKVYGQLEKARERKSRHLPRQSLHSWDSDHGFRNSRQHCRWDRSA